MCMYRCNDSSGHLVIFSNCSEACSTEVRSMKYPFNSSLNASQACSAGIPFKQSQTPSPALPKFLVCISHQLYKQAVSILSSHSKSPSFFATKDRNICKNVVQFFDYLKYLTLSKHLPVLVDLYHSTAFMM